MTNRGWIISKTVSVNSRISDSEIDNEQMNFDPVIGVYTISVVSDMISMHPNTLRKYDKFISKLALKTKRMVS